MKKKHILIVEDESFLVEMYKTSFEQAGYKVSVALNGVPVMDMVKKEHPQLILLDIVMPEKDGYTVIRELKKDKITKTTPVLIFSNLAQDYEIKKGLKLGADDYFVKTDYTPAQLVSKVDRLIGKKQQAKVKSVKKSKRKK